MSKERATLDKSRSYGTCYGPPGSARYEQDGKQFDAIGREIVAAKPAPAPKSEPEAEPEAGNDYAKMTVKELQAARKAHPKSDGKGFRPSVKKPDMIAELRALDAA